MVLTKEQVEKLRAKAKGMEKKNNGDFTEAFVQLKEGVNKDVRVLPALGEDPLEYYMPTSVHKTGKDDRHICPKLKGDDCPICELYFSVWQDINAIGKDDPAAEPFKKFARTLKAGEGYYLNVYDRDEKKVKILYAGQKLMSKIMNGNLDEDLGNSETLITDVQDGWDLRILMKKVDGFNNYDDSKFRAKSTPLGTEAENNAILADRKDLSVFVKYSEPSELKTVAADLREFYIENIRQEPSSPGTGVGLNDEKFKEELGLKA